jgi:hypothetical protein
LTYELVGTGSSSGSGSGSGSGAGSGSSSTGQVAVWTRRSTWDTSTINVSIDGSSIGSLTTYYTSTPNCGDSGTVTTTLAVGSYSLSASDGPNQSWGPSSITITSGGCLMYELM